MSFNIHELYHKLPQATLNRLGREVNRRAPAYGLTYQDERGKQAVITVTLRPRLVQEKMRNAVWKILRVLDRAFLKIPPLYFEIPSLASILPFTDRERAWLQLLREPGYRPGRVVSRWDANTTFSFKEWGEGFSFFEVNGVGVGGLWYGPATEDLILETVLPVLRKLNPDFRPRPNHDMRRLLLGVLQAQRRRIGRTHGVIAFMMEKASGSNFIEFERLSRLYRREGHPAIVTEPTDFRLKGGELFAKGKKVDILYRDTTLSELCALEEKGDDLSALREAFRQGQVVSSLEGEFDHKSAFEIFTSPEYSSAFTAKERALFKRHILWTRLLTERKTTGPRGNGVDLIPLVLKKQPELVLKPNRLYGGKGVIFGQEVKRLAWQKKIEAALKEPGGWVIQRLGKLRKKRFFRPSGTKSEEKNLYVVSGFFASEKGLGIVGRMSERKVVNVARRGGLTPLLVVK